MSSSARHVSIGVLLAGLALACGSPSVSPPEPQGSEPRWVWGPPRTPSVVKLDPNRYKRGQPIGWFFKDDPASQARALEVDRACDLALEESAVHHREKRYEAAIRGLETARKRAIWLATNGYRYDTQIERIDRIEALRTQLKAEKLEFDRERAIREANAARDGELAAERERTLRYRMDDPSAVERPGPKPVPPRAPPTTPAIAPAATPPPPAVGFAAAPAPRDQEPGPTGRPSTLLPHTSRVRLANGTELPVEAMRIAAHIDGFVARVVVDLRFHNDVERPHELSLGRFSLRLPDGASPYFLAFGPVDGSLSLAVQPLAHVATRDVSPAGILASHCLLPGPRLRAAVMVERDRAYRAFESTVARRVDPALVEWVGAGVFDARVFPIGARGSYRIVLGYDVPLAAVDGGLALDIDLPDGIPQATCDIGVRSDASDVDIEPAPLGRLEGERQWFRAAPGAARRVHVRVRGPVARTIAGTDEVVGPCFAARLEPEVPAEETLAGPRRAVFAIDRSSSIRPERLARALALVAEILARNRSSLAEFALLAFANDGSWWRAAYSPNTEPAVAECLTYCRALALEGGTDLAAALGEARRPSWCGAGPTPDAVFLMSDGIATLGDDTCWTDAPPVFAYALSPAARIASGHRSGPTPGVDRLVELARRTQGAVFTVPEQGDLAAAAVAHVRRPWSIRSAAVDGATDLLIAGSPTALFPGQVLNVGGRGAVDSASALVLVLSNGRDERTVRCSLGPVVASELASRAYGQIATAELEASRDQALVLAPSYARHFRVPGSSCSLLMLESDGDYRRFDIDPDRDRERDAAELATRPAAEALAAAQAALAQVPVPDSAAVDARAAFLERIDRRCRATPTVALAWPAELRAALAQVPVEAFAPPVDTPREAAIPGGRLDADPTWAETERRARAGDLSGAIRYWSSTVDQAPQDPARLRALGAGGLAWGAYGQGYRAFGRLADLQPWDPRPWIGMASCLGQAGRLEMAAVCGWIALSTPWSALDSLDGDVAAAAAVETLPIWDALLARAPGPLSAWVRRERDGLVARLRDHPVDLAVTCDWSTRGALSLDVRDPTGERTSPASSCSRSGGWLSTSSDRFGPVLYVLPRAPHGRYTVASSTHDRRVNAGHGVRTEVLVAVHRDWGRPTHRVTYDVAVVEMGSFQIAAFEVR